MDTLAGIRNPLVTDGYSNFKQSPSAFVYRNGILESAKNIILPRHIVNTSEDGVFVRAFEQSSSAFADRDSEYKPLARLPVVAVAQNHPVNVIDTDTVVIQIWEGRVLGVACESMQVSLSAKMGVIPEHTGTIELQWVAAQDADLVKPGAIFYLTLFKRIKRGSVENSQELRFRRRPNWSKSQLDKIDERAKKFLSKIKNKSSC